MATKKSQNNNTSEIDAIRDVVIALGEIDTSAQARVLKYVAEMLKIPVTSLGHNEPERADHSFAQQDQSSENNPPTSDGQAENDVEGLNSVGIKWMRRSGLEPIGLSKLFSLGLDEIDLVAKDVPGKGKRERMRNVLLLKAIAAYLETGTPRVMFEQLKEACLHYKAYDATNFATHLKSISAEVGGTKESGYTLSARGLSAATDLVKQMLT